jgi:hypothetical protein
VIIWDLSNSQPNQILTRHLDAVTSVAWSADGRLASGSVDTTVIVWDLSTGQPAQTLEGDAGPVSSVAWSVDGHHLASGSEAGAVIVWDRSTGQPAYRLNGHTDSVSSVAWSPDGDLASSSSDKTIKIARAAFILNEPCDWIDRNMTADEWVALQGLLYLYRPACPNLPVPSENLRYPSLTLKGRSFILGFAIILFFPPIALYSFIVSGSYFEIPYKLFRWFWNQFYG